MSFSGRMEDVFSVPEIAVGYGRARPAVHPFVIDRVVARLRLLTPVLRALDVGCGAGLSTRPLQRTAGFVLGVDPVEAMLCEGARAVPGAAFMRAGAESLALRGQSIDLVTAAGSLNYVDLGRFFPEAARVLRPSGALVVYDFSPGRSFPDSTALGEWYSAFLLRFPPVEGAARTLDPESIAHAAASFVPTGEERFEIALRIEPSFYVDYVMTESNVSQAIRRGTPAAAVRRWCTRTLEPVFRGEAHDVVFHGSIVYLVPATSDPAAPTR